MAQQLFEADEAVDAEFTDDDAIVLDTSDTRFRRIGLTLLGITFGLFGGWATFAPLEGAALAPGVVMVKNYRKTVQHFEGGIVEQIRVRDGDLVQKGEVLVVLDDTQARAQHEILLGQFISYKAIEARLLSERDGLSEVSYPDVLTGLDDSRVDDSIAGQNQVFQARKSSREGEISVLKQRIDQLRSQIEGQQAVAQSRRTLLASYGQEIDDLSSLLAEGYTDKQRLMEVERSHARLEGDIAEIKSTMAANEIRIGETRLQILQLKKDGHTEVVSQLGDQQAKLFDVNERIAATQSTLERTDIKAPESGMVLGLTVHTVGGVIGSGVPILDIVPVSEELIVEAQVSPIDIDRVHTGQVADIRFSAFKSSATAKLQGIVINLSADSLVNEQSGLSYYLARVEVTKDSMDKLGELKLLPGMPAEVLINTGARTLLNYLMRPASDAFARSLIED